ncbi:unnamed protein product, partial [Owenia fusiformis]
KKVLTIIYCRMTLVDLGAHPPPLGWAQKKIEPKEHFGPKKWGFLVITPPNIPPCWFPDRPLDEDVRNSYFREINDESAILTHNVQQYFPAISFSVRLMTLLMIMLIYRMMSKTYLDDINYSHIDE